MDTTKRDTTKDKDRNDKQGQPSEGQSEHPSGGRSPREGERTTPQSPGTNVERK